MSRDAVVMAMATYHRRVATTWDSSLFLEGAEGKRWYLARVDHLKSTLRDRGAEEFTREVQRYLAEQPDFTVGFLEDLFADVLGDEQATWDQFEPLLREE